MFVYFSSSIFITFFTQLPAEKGFKSTIVNVFFLIVERPRWYPMNFSGSKVRSFDRNKSKRRATNVSLASADVPWEEDCMASRRECLRRRLARREKKIGLHFSHFPVNAQLPHFLDLPAASGCLHNLCNVLCSPR